MCTFHQLFTVNHCAINITAVKPMIPLLFDPFMTQLPPLLGCLGSLVNY